MENESYKGKARAELMTKREYMEMLINSDGNSLDKFVDIQEVFDFIDEIIIDTLKNTPKIMKDYSKDEIVTRFLKMSLSSVKEFANLVKDNEYNLKEIQIPTLIIQGNNDALVPLETADFIYNTIPSEDKNILICDGVTHDVFRSEKKEEITNEIIDFLE